MEALIDLAIAETNTAFDQSGVEIILNLVYGDYIEYDEKIGTNLDPVREARNELNRKTDGIIDEAHDLRADYAAGENKSFIQFKNLLF